MCTTELKSLTHGCNVLQSDHLDTGYPESVPPATMLHPVSEEGASSDGDSDACEELDRRPAPTDPCYRCRKRVYPVERIDVGVLFHRYINLANLWVSSIYPVGIVLTKSAVTLQRMTSAYASV